MVCKVVVILIDEGLGFVKMMSVILSQIRCVVTYSYVFS